MTTDPHGYNVGLEVAYNETMGHWYIVEKRTKGSVLHRNILAHTYDTEAEANEAAAIYAKTA